MQEKPEYPWSLAFLANGACCLFSSMGIMLAPLLMGVFAGVIVGIVTAALHNRFYRLQLQDALAWFSGVRFVPIISVIAHIGVGIICFFVWPTIQSGIFALGNLVMHSGYFGTAIFGY